MRKALADRAPFKAVPITEIEPRPEHNFRYWQEQGYVKFIVDRQGIVVRMCREGTDIEAMADDLNERAALTLMIHDTAADPAFNADMWKPYEAPK